MISSSGESIITSSSSGTLQPSTDTSVIPNTTTPSDIMTSLVTSVISSTDTTTTSTDVLQNTPSSSPSQDDTTSHDTTPSTPENQSSTFPIAIVAALVGVVVVLIILIIIGGAVVLGCFIRSKDKSHRAEVLQLQGVVMERNYPNESITTTKLTSLTSIEISNDHEYAKTSFNLKSRSKSSQAVTKNSSAAVVISDDGSRAFYSVLNEKERIPSTRNRNQISDPCTTQNQEDADMYDEILHQGKEDCEYATVPEHSTAEIVQKLSNESRGGGREGGVELVRNEAYTTSSEIMVSDENTNREYEEIRF